MVFVFLFLTSLSMIISRLDGGILEVIFLLLLLTSII